VKLQPGKKYSRYILLYMAVIRDMCIDTLLCFVLPLLLTIYHTQHAGILIIYLPTYLPAYLTTLTTIIP
jgi:hypothetical protein